MYMHTLD